MAGNAADVGRTVAGKVSEILLTFANGGEYTLSEIARLTGLPVSSTHRYIAELEASDVVTRTGNGRYRAGATLKAVRSEPPLPPVTKHECARRMVEDLGYVYMGASVRLGVLDGPGVAYIEKVRSTQPVSLAFVSATLPALATAMGKVLVAFAAPETADRIVAQGVPFEVAGTLTSPERLRAELAAIRRTGIAVCQRGPEPATFAMSAPVVGGDDQVVAALELNGLCFRDLRFARPGLMIAARILSRDLRTSHRADAVVIHAERQLDVFADLSPRKPVPAIRGQRTMG